MKSDFDMIVRQFPKQTDLTIYPISDVHLGAAEHMEKEWADFIDKIAKEKNSYIILGGDLINNGTRNSLTNIFEEKYRPMTQKRIITEMLMPVRDKILCSVSGNHERRNKDVDDDPSYDIMAKLDLEDVYRPNIAFLKISIGDSLVNGLQNPTYTFVVTHGNGGGILTGATVNRNERFAYVIDGMDLLLVGHNHKPFITQPQKIYINKQQNTVSFKPFKVVSMTSWLSYGGYAVQKMLIPSSNAPQIIKLHGNKKKIEVTM